MTFIAYPGYARGQTAFGLTSPGPACRKNLARLAWRCPPPAASIIFSITWSTPKLAAFWRGGYSLNV
ncbi:hypothetical protein [Paraburkholderia sp. HD33-4]|uniref:hypothetical protein n=1 Tax=Paraburkholderia sp. HD33-4 TaxID=2883242 RepID=UPI001F37B60A|nr:hypothetical protein [Paraburkholderia sp. HD33-4]